MSTKRLRNDMDDEDELNEDLAKKDVKHNLIGSLISDFSGESSEDDYQNNKKRKKRATQSSTSKVKVVPKLKRKKVSYLKSSGSDSEADVSNSEDDRKVKEGRIAEIIDKEKKNEKSISSVRSTPSDSKKIRNTKTKSGDSSSDSEAEMLQNNLKQSSSPKSLSVTANEDISNASDSGIKNEDSPLENYVESKTDSPSESINKESRQKREVSDSDSSEDVIAKKIVYSSDENVQIPLKKSIKENNKSTVPKKATANKKSMSYSSPEDDDKSENLDEQEQHKPLKTKKTNRSKFFTSSTCTGSKVLKEVSSKTEGKSEDNLNKKLRMSDAELSENESVEKGSDSSEFKERDHKTSKEKNKSKPKIESLPSNQKGKSHAKRLREKNIQSDVSSEEESAPQKHLNIEKVEKKETQTAKKKDLSKSSSNDSDDDLPLKRSISKSKDSKNLKSKNSASASLISKGNKSKQKAENTDSEISDADNDSSNSSKSTPKKQPAKVISETKKKAKSSCEEEDYKKSKKKSESSDVNSPKNVFKDSSSESDSDNTPLKSVAAKSKCNQDVTLKKELSHSEREHESPISKSGKITQKMIVKNSDISDAESSDSSDSQKITSKSPAGKINSRKKNNSSSDEDNDMTKNKSNNEKKLDRSKKKPAQVLKENVSSSASQSESEEESPLKADSSERKGKTSKKDTLSTNKGAQGNTGTSEKKRISQSSSGSEDKSEKDDSDGDEDSKSKKKAGTLDSDHKGPSPGEKKLTRMKKFVLTAGIRINNYTNFWSGCKSTTAKVRKLQELLEEKGLKGRPTIEKCKKLRKKLENEREVAELDLGNIIGGGTRSRRGSIQKKREPPPVKEETEDKIVDFKQRFSRIKDIVSSESD